MTSARGRSAWLITWEWVGEHAAVDQPIAVILSVQSSPETVKQLMERLYASRTYTPEEMLAALPPRGHNPYRATYGSIDAYDHGVAISATYSGQLFCGHNPHLYARQVSGLRVGNGTFADGSRRLEWQDRPRPEGLELADMSPVAPLEPPAEQG